MLKFPYDRFVFFSDAVFAIAITLLVIEIKVPTHDQITVNGMAATLGHMVPLFIGFLVSFMVTALFWRWHMVLMTYAKSVDNSLLWQNIWLLLFVALLPFSSGLYSENFNENPAFIFYCCNVIAIGLLNFTMTGYIARKENLSESLGPLQTRWIKQRAMIVPIVFSICILTSLWSPFLGRVGFILIFVLQMVGTRYYRHKH